MPARDRARVPEKPELSVIVLNYNTGDLLRDCLFSLLENDPSGRAEIIVVDNNSFDGSADMVRREFPGVNLVPLDENRGFAAGMNQGIRRSRGDLLLLLNADTFLHPGTVDQLLDAARKFPQVGVAGPRLVDPEGRVQASCPPFPEMTPLHAWRFLKRLLGLDTGVQVPKGRGGGPVPVDWLHGACLLVRREMLREVGLFDEGFFLYGEDMDLCFRARLHGWCVAFFPRLEVIHYGNRSAAQVLGNEGSYPVIKLRLKALHRFLCLHHGPGRSLRLRVLVTAGALLASLLLAPSWLIPVPAVRKFRKRSSTNLKLALAGLSGLVEPLRQAGTAPAHGQGSRPGAFPRTRRGVGFGEMAPEYLDLGEDLESARRQGLASGREGNLEPLPEPGCLVIIPVHNEESTIERVVRETEAHVPADILVVDDGSSDHTREKVEWLGVDCLSLPRNAGVGNAEREAFRLALARGYAYAVRVDGDGQHDPAFISSLLRELEEGGYDLVIGTRYRDGYWNTGKKVRPLGTCLFSSLISRLIGVKITDATCGMRAYSRRAMRILMQHQPDHYPEIASFLVAARYGLRISEVPIPAMERMAGSSHLKPLFMARYGIVNLGRILYYRWGRYPSPRAFVA